MLIVDPTSDLHNENQAWERDLTFWKQELYKLNKLLASIAESRSDDAEHKELLKFKRRFDNHIDATRALTLAIKDHEGQLRDDSLTHYNRFSELATTIHSNLGARIKELRKEYEAIKTEYYEFLNNNS